MRPGVVQVHSNGDQRFSCAFAKLPVACVVAHVLQTEPTIRIVLTACRLAGSVRKADERQGCLMILDFWLSCLREAVDKDPFWGSALWKDLEPRALNLENGFRQLARQCTEIEGMGQSGNGARQTNQGACVKTSSVGAPERLGKYIPEILVMEESSWMQRSLLSYWTTRLADASNVGYDITESAVRAPRMAIRSVSS